MTPERKEKLSYVLDHRQDDVVVVMENVEDPRNITAVMRSCDGVGIQNVHIISTSVKRPKKWSYYSGKSAEKWISLHHHNSVAGCLNMLKEQGFTILTTRLSDQAKDLYELDLTQKIALVFGNESIGISEELHSMADGNFLIPQVGMLQSLNISVACAISIYEVFRQKRLAGHYDQAALPQVQMAQLMEQWKLSESD